MDHPKDVGDRSQLAVMRALTAAGYAISVPFGENTRYDLIVDDGLTLLRVQCKTGRLRRGAVLFAACSTYGHHRNPATARRTYAGQIDALAVYCPDNGGVYVVPVDESTPKISVALRVDPPRNCQHKRVRMAADYHVAVVPRCELVENRQLRLPRGAA